MAIKIEGPGRTQGGGSIRRAPRSDGGGDTFARHIGESRQSAPGVAGPAGVAGIQGLLALQEVDDAAARASRGKRRAEALLDALDELRHGLLIGAIPRDKLIELARTVQARRGGVDDPRLAEILDEIDLRAQVELAKLDH